MPSRDVWVDSSIASMSSGSGSDQQHDQRDKAGATQEDNGYTELINSMREILPEGELPNKILWKLGYVPPLHLRLPSFSYGSQTQCTFDEILRRETPRTSMDSVGSPGRAGTRPIPASYYRTSPDTSTASSSATSRASSMDYPLDVQPIESSRFASSRIESVEQPSSTYKSGTSLVQVWYKSGTSLVQVWRSEYKSLLPEVTGGNVSEVASHFGGV